jgi:glutamate/tyrosine decarboxylase-like PLP-dependent enzyme
MTHPDTLEELLAQTVRHALAYRRSLAERPVASSVSPEALLEQLSQGPLPDAGLPPLQVLEELVRTATPGLTAMSGPRFFGWVTGGTLPSALAADWLTSVWDQNAGPANGAPAAAAFELVAVRWVVELLGLPAETRGALVTGAMMANLAALAGARSQVLAAAGWDVERDGLFGAPPLRVLVGRERHASIDKSLRLLGLGKRSISVVEADAQGRLRPHALREALKAWAGPVIICAQLGNVDSGAFDPLPEISAALDDWRSERAPGLSWLHVDGAFGLWARASRSLAARAPGAEAADSWATDAHKTLNVPYDSGIALTRHPDAQRRALAIQAAYLASGGGRSVPNPGALTPELSRRARSFALWAALRELGRDGVDRLVTRCAEHARALAAAFRQLPGANVLNEVVFNQVVLGLEPPAGAEPRTWLAGLCVALQQEGTCYPTPTLWRGSPALRFSVVNATTSEHDVLRTAEAVRRVYGTLGQQAPGT